MAEGFLGQYTQHQILINLKHRIVETTSLLDSEANLFIAEYRIDSVCRDAMRYQAVLPDGLIDLLLHAFRVVHTIREESMVQVSVQDQGDGSSRSRYRPEVLETGLMGRPSFIIHQNQLEFLAG